MPTCIQFYFYLNNKQTILTRLIGSPEDFSMEARIFHAIVLIATGMAGLSIPFDLFLGIPALTLIMTGILFIGMFVYYLSRQRKKLNTAIIVFGLMSNCVFVANHTQNSGFYGPSLIMFLVSLFLIIAVAPTRQYRFWIPLNLLTVIALLYLEYNEPQIAPNSYKDYLSRYIDLGFSYVIIATLLISAIAYIRRSFHKQQEALLKQAAELKLANETKDKLFSIVAHDLRSPLGSIQNYLELISEYELTAEEKANMEQELLVKTKDTGQMMFNLLNWSMKQMDGVSVTMETLNLKTALNHVLNIQNTLAREKGIDLIDEISEEVNVRGDLNMLQLVVRNILSNAIKFTSHGGMIKISSSRGSEKTVIAISDNGIGISDTQKKNLFSMKTKPAYGTGNEKGLGLGLVLCKEFVELQDGSISFESNTGKGTTFYINLPNHHIN